MTRHCQSGWCDTGTMAWTGSPAGGVSRKRLIHLGPPESGQVTSVVRFAAGSRFAMHPHPGGEEILVLDGVFSDAQGDWPAGTYLLNPEGFVHAPWSETGCTLFVRLRQHPGPRRAIAMTTSGEAAWRGQVGGPQHLDLHRPADQPDATWLEDWPAGHVHTPTACPDGLEIFIVTGTLTSGGGTRPPGAWLNLAPGESFTGSTADGCRLYMRRGGGVHLAAASHVEPLTA
ncbi:MAG: cupin domain-containing protein [Alphaproteobacteria bacterium]